MEGALAEFSQHHEKRTISHAPGRCLRWQRRWTGQACGDRSPGVGQHRAGGLFILIHHDPHFTLPGPPHPWYRHPRGILLYLTPGKKNTGWVTAWLRVTVLFISLNKIQHCVNFFCTAKRFSLHTYISLSICFSSPVHHRTVNVAPCAAQEGLVYPPYM